MSGIIVPEISDTEEDVDYDDDDYDEDGFSYDHNGGIDDLYDDVQLEAGYDAWDTEELTEYNLDEEWNVFNFCPPSIFHEDVEEGLFPLNYNTVVTMAENLLEQVRTWKNRKNRLANNSFTVDIDTVDEVLWKSASDLNLNLYQIDFDLRNKLKWCSINNVEESKVLQLQNITKDVLGFLKRALIDVMQNCIPYFLPSPVINSIYSYLIATEGLTGFKYIASEPFQSDGDDDSRFNEECSCQELFEAITSAYNNFSGFMFYVKPHANLIENNDGTSNIQMCVKNIRIKLEHTKSLFQCQNFDCNQNEVDAFE